VRRRQPVWAVIGGGGTAGHVVPAIAIGEAFVERGHPKASLLFLGSRRGMEGRMIPEAGFEVTLLPGRGLARRFALQNVAAAFGLLVAMMRAVVLVRRSRPRVVVTVGGYASVAAGFAAVAWRVPLVVAEQNAAPGLANRLMARFAKASAVSFPGTPLPRAVVTGNPVRARILTVDRSDSGRAAARAALGLPRDRLVIAVAGGSLGARRINHAVVALAREWLSRPDVCILHVVGERDFGEISASAPLPVAGGLVYDLVRFEDRMDLLLSAADVAVQRAGASTVAELAAAGVPSILVPLPGAPGDHQTANALRMQETGAAIVIPDDQLDAGRLASELDVLLSDPTGRAAMGEAAKRMAHPGAADAVAALAEEHARA
jgi:UDP-N-acetylglucosamine--N-acetylmuramyl-(pentapeptide) pyrophosphoryl-undecaprenol N-acetylglucosamine transferase